MALPKGDYLVVAEKVTETLLGDVGPGGLRETNECPVKTIEARVRREAKLYSKYELPLIGVEVGSKKEQPGPSSRLVDKIFKLDLLVLCRGGDRELEVERAKKITARLESIIREQNLADKQFSGLAVQISGSQGSMITRIISTDFESRFFEDANDKNPEISAVITAEIIVPSVLIP